MSQRGLEQRLHQKPVKEMELSCDTKRPFQLGGGVAGKLGFTLTEVVMCLGIAGLAFTGIITGYVQSAREAEWSGYSLAAQALSLQQVEQFRAARWDPRAYPPVDETISIPSVSAAILDLPISGTNAVWATNYVTYSVVNVSTNSTVLVKMIRVDTVWDFRGQLYTNTTATYRAPDK